ncbi:MAG: hypothetical protein KDA65_09520 [Planctomycetaceae bacterium]|nr:hypothetical protein [Planctomycetaceae bacterium]
MNNLKNSPELEQSPTTETAASPETSGKFNLTELWQEFLLDLLMATLLGLLVYRYSYSSGWAVVTGLVVLLAGILKQGLKHLITRAKPHYKKSPAWVKLFIKTTPFGLLAMIAFVKLLGTMLGLFSAAVFMVALTTVIWLNQTDVPRF